jgi:hypothetical protein
MRFTVHAEQRREPVEFEFASPIEAISKAWQLMAAGATHLYIYDDDTDEAYWPNTFVELHKACLTQGDPAHLARRCVQLSVSRRR